MLVECALLKSYSCRSSGVDENLTSYIEYSSWQTLDALLDIVEVFMDGP